MGCSMSCVIMKTCAVYTGLAAQTHQVCVASPVHTRHGQSVRMVLSPSKPAKLAGQMHHKLISVLPTTSR